MINKKIKLLMIFFSTIVLSIILFRYAGDFNILSLATIWVGATIYTVEVCK